MAKNTPLYRYPGTKPYEAGDYTLFKGRDEDIAKLFDLVSVENPVVLFSRSGLGKSSLLNAGLYHTITATNTATAIFIRFGACYKNTTVSPLAKLREMVQHLKAQEQHALLEKLTPTLQGRAYSLWYLFKNIQFNDHSKQRFVLIFDQFEELFTYPEPAIEQFKQELAELLYIKVPQELRDFINEKKKSEPNFISKEEANLVFCPLDIKMLFAIRSDRLSLLNNLTDFFPTILKNCYELKPLSREQAKQAIVYPAQLTDKSFVSKPFVFNAAVVDYILDSLTATTNRDALIATADKPDIETFQLQIVCKYAEDLVIERGLKEITNKDLGDIQLIFENLYQNIIRKLPAEQRLPARIMMEENLLVEHTRVSMPEIALLKQGKDKGLTTELIDHLVNTHIIRREQGGTVEISHDTLVEPILKSKQEREQQEATARVQAEQQEELNRQKELAAKEQLELANTRRRLRIVYALLGVALVAILAAVFLGLLANKQRTIAEIQKSNALTSAGEAERKKTEAQAALQEANKQKNIADAATLQAVTNAVAANNKEAEAVASLLEANRQKGIAQREKQNALSNAAEANLQRDNAETASTRANQEKVKADSASAEATKQRAIAETALREADKQRDTAQQELQRNKKFIETGIGKKYQGGIIFYFDYKKDEGLIAAEKDLDVLYSWKEAGEKCEAYTVTVDGVTYDDWHLPTREELSLLYFFRTVVGGFGGHGYWSSTETYNFLAWIHYFDKGPQHRKYKGVNSSVRPVRRFSLKK